MYQKLKKYFIHLNTIKLNILKRIFKKKKSRMMNMNIMSLTIADIGLCLCFPYIIDACFSRGWSFSIKSLFTLQNIV